jgi:hypothetical protein
MSVPALEPQPLMVGEQLVVDEESIRLQGRGRGCRRELAGEKSCTAGSSLMPCLSLGDFYSRQVGR